MVAFAGMLEKSNVKSAYPVPVVEPLLVFTYVQEPDPDAVDPGLSADLT